MGICANCFLLPRRDFVSFGSFSALTPLPIPGICRLSSDGEGTRRWFVTSFPFVCLALSAVGSSSSTLAQLSALGAEQGQPHMRLADSETGWRRGAPMPDYVRPA